MEFIKQSETINFCNKHPRAWMYKNLNGEIFCYVCDKKLDDMDRKPEEA